MNQKENNLDNKELVILSLLEKYKKNGDEEGVQILLEKYLLYQAEKLGNKESLNIENED